MRINFTRQARIIRLAALALLALCLVQTPIRAQALAECILPTPSVGLARGQTLRFTLINPNEPDSRGGREPVRAQVKLYDAHGNVIAESDEVRIPANEFRSFDFDRSDMSLAGEAGTGRVQVRAEVRYRFFAIVDRTRITPDMSSTSLELIDNSTGRTIGLLLPAVQRVRREPPNQ